MESALYGARLMHVFERSSPFVAMSAVSDLVNGWPGGIIQASRHGVFVTPLYHVNRLYGETRGLQRLRTEVRSPTFDSTREGKDVPVIDAVASRSADGQRVFVKLVNTSPAETIDARIDLRGVRVASDAEWAVLTAAALDVTNSFDAPDRVAPRREKIPAGNGFRVRLPKHSVTVITLSVAP
jgi:alpha-N-arabinofuranosidase